MCSSSFSCIVVVILSYLAVCRAQSSPQLLLQGRFQPNNQTGAVSPPQIISWSSSSIFIGFQGANTVTLSFTASPNTNVSFSINWLRFFIDDQIVGDGFTSYKSPKLTTTIRVDSGTHTLRIAKLSDPAKGEVTFDSAQLDRGRFLPPRTASLSSDRRILILGDSYTVGYGDAGAVIPNTCRPQGANIPPDLQRICQLQQLPDTECESYVQILNGNSLAAFGTITAEAFTADYQILATSGSGLVGFSYGRYTNPGWDLAKIQTILPSSAMMFNRTHFLSANPQYQLSSWIPQVVIVASGTNDWHLNPPEFSLADWVSQAVAFLQQISTAYNKPVILIQAWSASTQNANSESSSTGSVQVGDYLQAMPALVRQAKSVGLNNVDLLSLNTSEYDDLSSWCDGHPSALAHRSVARQLVTSIQQKLPDWTVDNPINSTVDQQSLRPNLSLLGGQTFSPVSG